MGRNEASENRPALYNKILTEIRRAMEDSGLSQSELGKALGIKQSAVSSLLSGNSNLNLSQMIEICTLLGISAHALIFRASHSSVNPKKQPEWISKILYKSWIHVVVYVSAARPIAPSDLVTAQIPRSALDAAIEDLMSVGLLKTKGDRIVQAFPDSTITGDHLSQLKCHQEIINKGMEAWIENRRLNSKDYFKKRFNFLHLDLFSDEQILQVETILWKAFEKIKEIQLLNTSSGYQASKKMRLWNVHFMLSTPTNLEGE